MLSTVSPKCPFFWVFSYPTWPSPEHFFALKTQLNINLKTCCTVELKSFTRYTNGDSLICAATFDEVVIAEGKVDFTKLEIFNQKEEMKKTRFASFSIVDIDCKFPNKNIPVLGLLFCSFRWRGRVFSHGLLRCRN